MKAGVPIFIHVRAKISARQSRRAVAFIIERAGVRAVFTEHLDGIEMPGSRSVVEWCVVQDASMIDAGSGTIQIRRNICAVLNRGSGKWRRTIPDTGVDLG
ncbi:MAG: hypothetical protein WA823_16935 [Candidatus Acidiferrales bacterium]